MTPSEVGTILQSGSWLNTRLWQIIQNTGKTIQLAELEWAKDLIKEQGCVYRATGRIRIKLRSNGIICKSPYGTFEVREHPVKVLG